MNNKLVVPSSKQAIERMKYEIANEFGVNLGPDATSRANGSVGGEITKRLVKLGENNIKTLDDLADLAADELIDIVGKGTMTESQANTIIMKAREHWFE